MDENGASIMEIKAQSRHKDIKTLEIYIRQSDEHIKNVYMNTVPTLSESAEKQTTKQTIEPMPQSQMIQQKQRCCEDRYIDLPMKKSIDKEDFKKLMGKNHQHIDGYV